MRFKSWVLPLCIVASAWFAAAACAQNFPERPVTLIVPWSPGGGTDVAMRALAETTSKPAFQKILERLDQQENFYMNSEDYARYAKKTFEEEKLYVDRMGLKQ